MFARWILFLLAAVAATEAIQRPDAKTTLRGLAKLPRIDARMSLDFDSARGFAALRTDKDAAARVTELRAKVAERPNDSRLLLEMAAARMDAGDLTGARRDLQRAADGARRVADAEGGNLRARLDLASALHGLGRATEAEAIFRELIKAAPRSQTNWLAFSEFLEARGWEVAGDVSNWKGRRANIEVCLATLRAEASSETLERARKYFEEGVMAARDAVRIDAEAAAHGRLAEAIASEECFRALQERMRGGEKFKPGIEMLLFTPKALVHLEKAAELERNQPGRLATALLWRGLSEAAEMRMTVGELGKRKIWDSLSEDSRRAIESGMQRLDGFSRSAAAGEALQARGVLRFLFRNDLRGAADDLRAAVSENPESEQVWETLLTVLVRSEDYLEFAAVAEARALVRPNVRNRLMVAKAYERLGNFDRVEEEITGALSVSNADFNANVALANVLMRRSKNGEMPGRVRGALVAAERALRVGSSGSQLVELALAQGIYYGLTDDFERARDILKAAQGYAKENMDVATALSAIGY